MFLLRNDLIDYSDQEETLIYPDHLQNFLYRDAEVIKHRCALLIQLDEYEDKLFKPTEVLELLGICEVLSHRHCFPREPWKLKSADPLIQDLHYFLQRLKSICIQAVYQDRLIFFQGLS
ncbi:hypothetical protein [Exiguobacterium antarcticum]|uniref:Uncharacterized protein n=1 Tax=Exiguobacterium antarcticum TaxID=132920 RepID=A0ABT6R4B6_9BACL|nr:hypothetical protein [Exiguobacterium antarcticum]AFS70365.1 Hypothetical protein Eab7_1231 [Exiguobacterium antarcticum B7]MDI3235121.1 hypothetical protein [Exiguobacterium antarcticum]